MTIIEETERHHDVLGPIRFDDGKGDHHIEVQDYAPHWVARPMGWMSDGVELLISGDSSGPVVDSLDRAIRVFDFLDKIEREGRDLIRPKIMNDVNLLWIDCQKAKTIAVFNCENLPYL